ncbi:MAG: hypothetical protein V3S14_01400 [Anaerolineae bacterium]
MRRTIISPTGDLAFVGSTDNYLYALNITSGELEWRYRTEGDILATPAIALGPSSWSAVVGGYWTDSATDTVTVTTDDNGIATARSDRTRDTSGTFTFTVDNVSKDGWACDPGANTETSDSQLLGAWVELSWR